MISITMKGLAKFIAAGPSAQRRVVHDFKYPRQPEPRAQTSYYRDAKNAIRKFRAESRPTSWLVEQAQLLTTRASVVPSAIAARLKENARAIREYAAHFGGHDAEILKDINLSWAVAGVRIKVRPDLHYRERNRERLMRFEFGSSAPDTRVLRVLCQSMFEAAAVNGLGVASRDCSVLDVPRGNVHRLARNHARTVRDIEAACKTISDMWPNV